MTNNNRTGRIIRTIIIVLCIINIVFLAIASRRGVRAGNTDTSGGISATAATAATEYAAASSQTAASETAASETTETEQQTENNTATPSITLSDNLPDLTQDDLDDIVPVLKDADAISADDGNGNDITDDIEAVTTADLDNLGDFTIHFSVTNDDGETAEATADVNVEITKPILELSTYHLTLDRNAKFDELSYVETAVDEDGDDLSRAIHVDGDVDTSKAGTYNVTYYIRSNEDSKRAEKTLRVTVR